MSRWPENVIIFTDGASRGNPGDASVGISVWTSDLSEEVFYWGEPLGQQTNNYAEYLGVVRALELALKHGVKRLELRSDSQLLIRQITGEYRVKNEGLRPLFQRVKDLEAKFESCLWTHVPREENKRADELANRALDLGQICQP
jgi:ribonuclease HI